MSGESFGLDLNNIIDGNDINSLFGNDDSSEENSGGSQPTEPNDNKQDGDDGGKQKPQDENNVAENLKAEDLFGQKSSEGVGNEDNEGKEGTGAGNQEGGGTSPDNKNFYTSIAKAFADDGIFPDLDEETISKITDAQGLREAIDNQIKAGLDERQKRIDEAMSLGLNPNEMQRYEQTINYLNSITDAIISDENESGENLRRQLIAQDFLNRGYSKERAQREVKKSFDAGSDIDDAKEALESNKEFFKNAYQNIIKQAKEEAEVEKKARQEEVDKLKKSVMEDKTLFGDVEINKETRQKVFDNITKPIYRDNESGEYYTALQKYEHDNRMDFLKNVSLIYTLTDGFKDLGKILKGQIRKETNKGIKSLEDVLNNTNRNSNGQLNFVTSVKDDPESFISKGFTIDV